MKPYNTVDNIIAYEQGDLSPEDTVDLFQHLVDTGLAWSLQGHYGRTAAAMLAEGSIQRESLPHAIGERHDR